MIQRIQTLFLFLVAVLHIALFFVPFWVGENALGMRIMLDAAGIDGANIDTLKNMVLGNTLYSIAITILNAVIVFLALGTIFIYNNRLQQIRLCRMAMILVAILLILMVLSGESVGAKLESFTKHANYSVGIFLPVVSLVLLFLAARRIRHDDNLVRSADRLR